ncbi:MAG TPA: CcdB family protein [Caulobacteraceae bacterium]|nr:CcdB family protein [Caulobacteraceae bacterium]
MRQFDIYDNPSAASATFAPYVLVLQSHYIELKSVVAAPLVTDKLPTDVEISLTFEGKALVLALTELGSIPVARLRRPLGNLLSKDYEIHRALDRLFKGF